MSLITSKRDCRMLLQVSWRRNGTFVSYLLSFLTSLAFRLHASPPVNNWCWPGACWVSKMAKDSRRPQRAPTWHTNACTHTGEGPTHSGRQEIDSNNKNEGRALEARQVNSHSPETTTRPLQSRSKTKLTGNHIAFVSKDQSDPKTLPHFKMWKSPLAPPLLCPHRHLELCLLHKNIILNRTRATFGLFGCATSRNPNYIS